MGCNARKTNKQTNFKVQSRTGHEGPKGEKSYSSALSLTSALEVGVLTPRPAHFSPGKETHYQFYRRMGGPQYGLEGCVECLVAIRIRSPDRPTRSESLYSLRDVQKFINVEVSMDKACFFTAQTFVHKNILSHLGSINDASDKVIKII